MTKTTITESIDRICATGMMPVRLADKSPHNPKTKPMGEDRVAFLEDKYPEHDLTVKDLALKYGLIAFGGQAALITTHDDDLEPLLARGQLWGKTSKMMKGADSQCHSNSCRLWEQNQDKLFLSTGYALSDDGLWRPHSWCMLPGARGAQVVETTVKRELYFGYVMTLDETIDFAFNNCFGGVEVHETTHARYRFGEEPVEAQASPSRKRPTGRL